MIRWDRRALRSKDLADSPRQPSLPRLRRGVAIDGKTIYLYGEDGIEQVRAAHPALHSGQSLPPERQGDAAPFLEQMEARDGALRFLEGVSVDAGMTSKEHAIAIDR